LENLKEKIERKIIQESDEKLEKKMIPSEQEWISELKTVNCNKELPVFEEEDNKLNEEKSGDLGDKSNKIKLDILLAGFNKI